MNNNRHIKALFKIGGCMKLKKLKNIIAIAVFVILLFVGCQKKYNINNDYGFFAWMDAYIATEINTENPVTITLFFDKEPFEEKDIVNITFLDIDKEVVINSFRVDNLGALNKDYSTYGITLNYSAEEVGVFETSGVKITLNTNKIIEYPVVIVKNLPMITL